MGKYVKRTIYRKVLYLALLLCLLFSVQTDTMAAGIAGDGAFYGELTWEKILEESVRTKSGVVQSICATEDYIICLENSGDTSKDNDVAYAYYKNSVDKDGNPVEQYSLAFTNDRWDWEHCNGMCYNRDAHEIYVALYTNNEKDNRGCVYVMDPDTLEYKGTKQIADGYNILGIGYEPKNGRYIIQTNAEQGYSIKILDGNFERMHDLGEADLGLGSNSQDLCVVGNYIINFPLTFNVEGQGSYMNVYSIDYGPDGESVPTLKLIDSVLMDLENQSAKKIEPESICEVEDGVFIATVNIMDNAKKRKYAWYKIELPYYYEIEKNCTGGSIITEDELILKGSTYRVKYSPDPGFELRSVIVDGNPVDIQEFSSEYLFENIQSDHTLSVEFTEIRSISDNAVTPTDSSDPDKTPADGQPKKKEKKDYPVLKILVRLLILILVLAGAGYGMYRYRQFLILERRKKYLRFKVQRERDKQMLQQIEDDMRGIPEEVDPEELNRLIEETESR